MMPNKLNLVLNIQRNKLMTDIMRNPKAYLTAYDSYLLRLFYAFNYFKEQPGYEEALNIIKDLKQQTKLIWQGINDLFKATLYRRSWRVHAQLVFRQRRFQRKIVKSRQQRKGLDLAQRFIKFMRLKPLIRLVYRFRKIFTLLGPKYQNCRLFKKVFDLIFIKELPLLQLKATKPLWLNYLQQKANKQNKRKLYSPERLFHYNVIMQQFFFFVLYYFGIFFAYYLKFLALRWLTFMSFNNPFVVAYKEKSNLYYLQLFFAAEHGNLLKFCDMGTTYNVLCAHSREFLRFRVIESINSSRKLKSKIQTVKVEETPQFYIKLYKRTLMRKITYKI